MAEAPSASYHEMKFNIRSLEEIKEGRRLQSHASAKPPFCEIGEGTNEIQRLIIGRQLIREMLGLTASE